MASSSLEPDFSPASPAPDRPPGLLRPGMRVAHVSDIDLGALRQRGIRGLIFDLDDTLVAAMSPTADPAVQRWIAAVKADFAVYVVSNNISERRVAIASHDLGLPYVARARKPSRRSFRRALAELGLRPEEAAIVGDQLFTDVLGGNRLGALTILVDPLSVPRRWHRRWMRSLETYVLRRHGGMPYAASRPSHEATVTD
ncbi:MAG: YqeG family HAD IIIA-type phosphatase [Candidatus Sericytochromatia bacterium]|nr:YqeG family HAD IIIA-type phosphatase [Candidatus Sericytochromatia bacterium]